MHARTHLMHTCTPVHTHACMYAYAHLTHDTTFHLCPLALPYTRMHAHKHTHTHTRTRMSHIHTCTHTSKTTGSAHSYTLVHTCICHSQMHAHTHTLHRRTSPMTGRKKMDECGSDSVFFFSVLLILSGRTDFYVKVV